MFKSATADQAHLQKLLCCAVGEGKKHINIKHKVLEKVGFGRR